MRAENKEVWNSLGRTLDVTRKKLVHPMIQRDPNEISEFESRSNMFDDINV